MAYGELGIGGAAFSLAHSPIVLGFLPCLTFAQRFGLGRCPILLGGYGTVACNRFPRTVLSYKSVGAEDSRDAALAVDQFVIGVRVGRDGGVVIDADLEITDHFAVRFIVGAVFHVGQDGFLGAPRSIAVTAGPSFGVILLEER